MPPRAAFRIAIVGCGPRGLQCLEALLRRLSDADLSRTRITVYEPAATPGAGPVYDPKQSHVLKMNLATQHIDFWKVNVGDRSPRSTSLLGWLGDRYPELTQSDLYVPRAIVGEYLCECFETVHNRLSQRGEIDIVRRRVQTIKRSGQQWSVTDSQGVASFDHVVLTTGHEGLRGSTRVARVARVARVEAGQAGNETFAFPAGGRLSLDQIPPSAHVLIRGFGLTALDVVLMLTQGRGGQFTGDGLLPRYASNADEPGRIDIRSRSGRPMLAKPTAKVEPISDAFWIPYRDEMTELLSRHGQLRFRDEVMSIVVAASSELLNQAGQPTSVDDVSEWLRGWGRYRMTAAAANQTMLRSVAVANGSRPKDIPYALGEAWRKLYPQMVELIGFGGLANDQPGQPSQWACYQRINCEMERIAFGPPAESLSKLLRLIRERVVTIGIAPANEYADHGREHDVIVNAVIASPHEHAIDGPLHQLLNDGTLVRDGTTGAVRVDRNGCAVDLDHGLAVFGRATEGWVVGNDTLSRTLHKQIEHWAECVAGLVSKSAATSTLPTARPIQR